MEWRRGTVHHRPPWGERKTNSDRRTPTEHSGQAGQHPGRRTRARQGRKPPAGPIHKQLSPARSSYLDYGPTKPRRPIIPPLLCPPALALTLFAHALGTTHTRPNDGGTMLLLCLPFVLDASACGWHPYLSYPKFFTFSIKSIPGWLLKVC